MTTETSNSTLESTRRLASEALERASTTVKEMRSGVHDAASRGMSAVTDRATAARGYVGDYARTGTRYVADNPLKSALIAATVGAAVAGLVIALRHRREINDKYF
jgi:ElaB/YqjD/DUF883 family membrane-anchored ribosome-binding protein